jgi:hypothetical protein
MAGRGDAPGGRGGGFNPSVYGAPSGGSMVAQGRGAPTPYGGGGGGYGGTQYGSGGGQYGGR